MARPPRKTKAKPTVAKAKAKATPKKKAPAKRKTRAQGAVLKKAAAKGRRPQKVKSKDPVAPKLRSFEQSFVDFLEARGVSYLAYQLQRCSKLSVKEMLDRAKKERWLDLLYAVKVEELDELIGVRLPEPTAKPRVPTSTRAMRRAERSRDVSARILKYVAKNRGKTTKQIRDALGLGALQGSAAVNRLRLKKKIKPTTTTPPYKWTIC